MLIIYLVVGVLMLFPMNCLILEGLMLLIDRDYVVLLHWLENVVVIIEIVVYFVVNVVIERYTL